jgi:ATP-dependent protease HslVU (ClpYQ) ATPase subunit
LPDHAIKVVADISDSQREALEALGARRLEEVVPTLARLALAEWLEWLVATTDLHP